VGTDVSEAPEVEVLIDDAVRAYGRLDYAFNNAATSEGNFGNLAEFEEGEFDRVVGANLKGVWLCMKHEIRQMLSQEPPGGAIVNTSSVNGLGGAPRGALYSATKAGVRVNALVAGAFRTPMLEGVFEKVTEGCRGAAREKWRNATPRWFPWAGSGHPRRPRRWRCGCAPRRPPTSPTTP
jgi:NAD(P)-dependent dehydrogenase (short-subunit alcohol dehydrogenase family)